MSVLGLAKFSFIAAVVVCLGQAREVPPVNGGANPYRVIRNWGMLPEGRPWGAAIDLDGMSVRVAGRCGNGTGCVGSTVDPIRKFDPSGKRLTSFGAGMFVWPHDGNIRIADSRRPTAQELKVFTLEKNKGSVVVKFTPEALTDPTNILTAPNGDICVAESHTSLDAPEVVGRISVFDKSGEFLRSFGKLGSGPGDFRTQHAMVFDSKGRLIVADRANHRILTSRTAPVVTAGNLYTAEATVRGVTKYVKK